MAERPPPALLDELVEEILLRLPPDDPALLVRAALACKAWCRLLSGPGFRRRFRQRHRTPPVLGVIENVILDGRFQFPSARFVPTSSFRPPRADRRGWRAVDSRHGRVLLSESTSLLSDPDLVLSVWNPVTDEQLELPALPRFPCRNWKAAVLCSAAGDRDHMDCSHGPFTVVVVGMSAWMSTYVYSSEANAWSERTSAHHGLLLSVHGAHVGNAIYYLVSRNDSTRRILMCDLGTLDMSVIRPPPMTKDLIVLMTAEVGGLGSVTLEGSKLYLWSRQPGPDGNMGWARIKEVEVEALARARAYVVSFRIASFADGISIVYLGTNYGSFTIDLKSERVTKIAKLDGFEDVAALYTSFYTPEFKVALTSEGPRDGASSA